jgi:hypothetical protein
LKRPYLAILGVMAVALLLRVPWLDVIPNPAGDEGNWAWYGYDLYEHRAVQLAPEARFVSLAFAHMIARAYKLLGPSFAAARSVLVAGTLAGIFAAWVTARRAAMPVAAITIATALAVHPWSVMWSRTVTVPYALALVMAVVGPLVWLHAVRRGSVWGVVLAAQILGAAMHFTPLALIPMTACGLWALWKRMPLRYVGAALTGLVHVVPLVVASVGAVQGYSGRQHHFFNHFGLRLYVFVRTVIGGLNGESTLRHFAGTQGSLVFEWLLLAVTVLVIFLAVRTRDERTEVRELKHYAALHGCVALVGLPLLLATARPWNLPAIDAERYVFVVVAPFVLLLGAMAERGGRSRILSIAAIVGLLCIPTVRLAHFFLSGGTSDHGFYTLASGGGYRGWKVTRSHENLPQLIRHTLNQLRANQPAHLVTADYAWNTLHLLRTLDHWQWDATEITKSPLPMRPGVLHVFVLWSDGLFAPTFTPQSEVDDNQRLRALMHSPRFTNLRQISVYQQPNGSPLCEVWAAVGAVGWTHPDHLR